MQEDNLPNKVNILQSEDFKDCDPSLICYKKECLFT